ncbi:protein FAM110C [Choloepus didactylus]|uniref:protein FAM110C n=1 Tax=Choloepus didactylus TaxID=27675 RepID=UPI00189FD98F|nr:protein FAM110C [Choloepus didactylus]
MPAGVAPGVRMHALSAFDASLSERLLHRGPEYLRQHLDAPRPARRSAVERLAADRAKYVKSQLVAGPAHRPAGQSSASESSSESCSEESRRSARDAGGREGEAAGASPSPARTPCPVARRAIARKPLRPDSLVIYRQKCEFVKGPGADSSRGRLVKKLFQTSSKDKALVPPDMPKVKEEVRAEGEEASLTKVPVGSRRPDPVADPVPSAPPAPSPLAGASGVCQALPSGPALRESKRRGLHRSQSDISSRYSKCFAEFDTFFQYCGLDPEVVEDLGRENFSAGSDHATFKIRSVSIATSDSGFSRRSGGDEGLQEEELTEQVPSTTSVIEKNARIIKWLYTCKKAKETPSKRLQELA